MVNRDNRRVIRVNLETPLTVSMGSIGSQIRYDLVARDISNNGFFLDFDKPGRFPFTAASIMEVWLGLDNGKTVFFNGKMARVVYPPESKSVGYSHNDINNNNGPGIAIRIVQIEPDQEKLLVDFISRKIDEQQDVELVKQDAS